MSLGMLLNLLQDPKVAAALAAILSVLVTHIIWLRKWHLEKQYHASQLADERARQDRLRFLNDLSKDYATLMLAINEVHLQAQSNLTKPDSVEIHRKDAVKALAEINNVAPRSIVDAANASWMIATLIFNHDQKYAPDFLEVILRAYLSDFHALAKLHLSGAEKVALESDASQVNFVRKTFDVWLEELPGVFEDGR
jgi:hypothetical protein